MQSRVYFFVAFEVMRVKIGVSEDVQQRFRDVQAASPVRLKVSATIPGDIVIERTLHRLFSKSRLHGEWFRLTSDIQAFIIQANSGTPPQIPDGERTYPRTVETRTWAGTRMRATPAQYFGLCEAIYGQNWVAHSARRLKVSKRSVMRWKKAAEKGQCKIPRKALDVMLAAHGERLKTLDKMRAELSSVA